MNRKIMTGLLTVLLLAGMLTGCGAADPASTAATGPVLSDAAKAVMQAIDAIPDMAEDGSNARQVYEAYTAAQNAYFSLDYDEMNLITNVGKMWKASDDYFSQVMTVSPGTSPQQPSLSAEDGALLSGIWYDSSSVIFKEYSCWQIGPDGAVVTPFYTEAPQYVSALGDGTYYVPDYGTVYPEYSMGDLRLANVDGSGCLISQAIIDRMYVTVELDAENVSDYFTFDPLYSYIDEWGDTASYADNDQTSYAALDKLEGSDLVYVGSNGVQVELLLDNGKKTTFYGVGQLWIDGKDVKISDFGRAKGTMYYVKREYVWNVEASEGFITVSLNDGSRYSYYHGDFPVG